MEGPILFLFWFVIWMSSSDPGILLILGQDPYNNPGFISIDCGAPTAHNNTELQIYYETDDGFIDSGYNRQVSSDFMHRKLPSGSKTLRVFPNGMRNCYTIRPTTGGSGKYLIRASFLYGNYDGHSQAPTFNVFIGVNYWTTISFSAFGYCIHREIVHVVPSTDHAIIQVCLVNTGEGIPFISSLELRPLDGTMYRTNATTLALHTRINIGGNTTFRHPQDAHDRLWFADGTNYKSTTEFGRWDLSSDPLLDTRNDLYDVPREVLETFAMLRRYNSPTSIPAGNWILYFHFAEMVQLSPVRNFTIYINDKLETDVSLEYLRPKTIASELFSNGIGFNINFVPNNADQSPILNALELYYLLDLSTTPTALDDANAMNDIKTTYSVTRESWHGDPCVPSNFTWDGLICSTEDPPRITSLNLSSSGLKGYIADSFANLAKVEYLNLSHNELTGSVPEFLAKLTNLKSLDLTGNNLSGSVPKSLQRRANTKTLRLSLAGNPNLCQSGSCGSTGQTKNIIIIASASGLTLVVVCIWIILCKKQSAHRKKSMGRKGMSGSGSHGISGKLRRRFTLDEVTKITGNFDTRNVIGQGAFGKVFRGKLDDGTEVAVKKLSQSAKEGPKQFQTEAKLLLKIHHRNLVSLLGYCDEPENMALIYEYLAKGNLHENLSGKNGNFLTWNQRLCIAVDVVKGLNYLHNDCNPPIIHRDIKTANILLDNHVHAKISDFGLSRIVSSASGIPIATDPVGTHGYIDPEYCMSRSLTKKSDVYSFGVVLLELVTACQVQNGEHTVDWAAREVKRRDFLQRIVDPRLDGQYDSDSAEKLVMIAMSCLEKTAARRPDIRKVHADLGACWDQTFERSQGMASEARNFNISSYHNVESSKDDSTATSSSYRSKFRAFTEAFWSS